MVILEKYKVEAGLQMLQADGCGYSGDKTSGGQ